MRENRMAAKRFKDAMREAARQIYAPSVLAKTLERDDWAERVLVDLTWLERDARG